MRTGPRARHPLLAHKEGVTTVKPASARRAWEAGGCCVTHLLSVQPDEGAALGQEQHGALPARGLLPQGGQVSDTF